MYIAHKCVQNKNSSNDDDDDDNNNNNNNNIIAGFGKYQTINNQLKDQNNTEQNATSRTLHSPCHLTQHFTRTRLL